MWQLSLLCMMCMCVRQELVQGSVYCLYEPPDGEPLYDIVFFHGLQLSDYKEAWRTTWESDVEGGKVCWPGELLSQDFPRARVLSVSYDSSAIKSADTGRSDLVDLGMSLTENLCGNLVNLGTRPVVLVGHSLGGLVMKQICVELDKRSHHDIGRAQQRKASGVLKNIKGLAFYGTPHGGSKLADLAEAAVGWWPSFLIKAGDVTRYLGALSKDTGRVNQDFDKVCKAFNWDTLGFYELHATKV